MLLTKRYSDERIVVSLVFRPGSRLNPGGYSASRSSVFPALGCDALDWMRLLRVCS